MDRYIGLDVHATSTTLAVVGPSGRGLKTAVIETNGKALIEALKTIPEPRHVCFEEGTQAEWLYQVLKPHAAEIVVAKVESSRGQKSDAKDAFGLAELLRTGKIGTRVFKDVGAFATLRDLSRLYSMLRDDVVRTKNRIKSLYRSRGVATPDGDVYAAKHRAKWLKTLTPGKRLVAEKLYDELDKQSELKDAAEAALVEESRRHPAARVLETCPGFGPIRAAQMMAIVVAPHRFRTKRQFWAYCGLGIVTRSSSDWVPGPKKGDWLRAPVQVTRGLNCNHNHLAKAILKGAATMGWLAGTIVSGDFRQNIEPCLESKPRITAKINRLDPMSIPRNWRSLVSTCRSWSMLFDARRSSPASTATTPPPPKRRSGNTSGDASSMVTAFAASGPSDRTSPTSAWPPTLPSRSTARHTPAASDAIDFATHSFASGESASSE